MSVVVHLITWILDHNLEGYEADLPVKLVKSTMTICLQTQRQGRYTTTG